MDHDGEPEPRVVQLVGSDPAELAAAARVNVDLGAQIIDINMGCPAKKVCNRDCGSALLADEALVERILERRGARGGGAGHAQDPHRHRSDAAQRRAYRRASRKRCGIAALTIHGRTRADLFRGAAEYDTIRATRAAARHAADRQRRYRFAATSARGT